MAQRKIVKISIIFVLTLSMLMLGNASSSDIQAAKNELINLNHVEENPPEVLRMPMFVAGSPSQSRELDPWIHLEGSIPSWWSLVYSPLIDYDVDAKIYVSKLAIDWYSNFDGTVWTFVLRENVQFQDGSKFNSFSILAEINRAKEMKDRGILTPINSRFWGFIDLIQDVTIYSDYQLSFNLIKPYSPFLSKIVNIYFAAPSASVGTTVVDRIGSGPYIYDKVNSTSFLEKFNRNELYFEGPPPFKVIEMIDYRDGEQEEALRENKLDLLPTYFKDFQMDDITYILRDKPILNSIGLFNTQNPIFSNSKVRRALNYAVDHAKLNEELFQELLSNTFDNFRNQNYTLFPGAANNAPNIQNQFSYDLSKSARLLDEAGFELDTNGNRFNITIVSRANSFNDQSVKTLIEVKFFILGCNSYNLFRKLASAHIVRIIFYDS
ncbi:MAG: ABC transporter substrate-binding protein [Candidatus Heimdallarchaeota archaeon]